MPKPALNPISTTPTNILSASATPAEAEAFSYPINIYGSSGPLESQYFFSGAAEQVGYTYKKLGGDILDIELKNENIYTAYHEACLEYSYIVNLYQGKSVLGALLGQMTGSFDHHGKILEAELQGKNYELRFPRFEIQMPRRISDYISREAGVGGDVTVYSASLSTSPGVQDYDLEAAIAASRPDIDLENKKVRITNFYYKTTRAIWRFFAYYGALNVIGNLGNYGQWSDDTTFEMVPTWQNKLQAMMYEDSIYTRISHYSYEIINNTVKIMPTPSSDSPEKFWFRFYIPPDPWEETSATSTTGIEGVNSINTLPFGNLPYININSIGKQWIRRYALAVTKEILSHVRGKMSGVIPIPGSNITLNSGDLMSQSREEKEALRNELKEILDSMTYDKVSEQQANMIENASKATSKWPLKIYAG